jgi:signal transduction histidine kinase
VIGAIAVKSAMRQRVSIRPIVPIAPVPQKGEWPRNGSAIAPAPRDDDQPDVNTTTRLPKRGSARAWHWPLALSVVVCVIYVATPSAAVRDSLMMLSGLIAVCAATYGAFRASPLYRRFAWLFAGSVAASFLGDAIWGYLEVVRGIDVPLASPADIAYLAAYPLIAWGLVCFPRPQQEGSRAGLYVDCAIIITAITTIAWELFFEPNLESSLSLQARLVGSAYPALGVLVLTGLIALRFRGAWSTGMAVIACGVTAEIVADSGFALLSRMGTYGTGSESDLGWLIMYGCFGAAALHPSFRSAQVAADRRPSLDVRLPLLFAAALVPTVITCIHGLREPIEFVVESVTVLSLVFCRLSIKTRTLRRSELARARQNDRLRAAAMDRQRLLSEIMGASERETTRLSADLHDGPVQRLAALGYLLGQLELSIEPSATSEQQQLVADIAAQLSSEILALRSIMQDLRPPSLTQHGLAAAIEGLARTSASRHGIQCTTAIEPVRRMDAHEEAVAYRIAEEALLNVTKHAAASHIHVKLFDAGGTARLVIADDGTGFDETLVSEFVEQRRFGLAIMRERAEALGGTCVVRSGADRGTTVTVFIPTDGATAEDAA